MPRPSNFLLKCCEHRFDFLTLRSTRFNACTVTNTLEQVILSIRVNHATFEDLQILLRVAAPDFTQGECASG